MSVLRLRSRVDPSFESHGELLYRQSVLRVAVMVADDDTVRRAQKQTCVDDADNREQSPFELPRRPPINQRYGEGTIENEIPILGHERPRPARFQSPGGS